MAGEALVVADAALRLMDDYVDKTVDIASPDLLPHEVLNALSRLWGETAQGDHRSPNQVQSLADPPREGSGICMRGELVEARHLGLHLAGADQGDPRLHR